MQIAQAALTALGHQCTLAVGREIGDAFAGIGIGDHRAHRHPQHDVVGAAAVLVGAASVLSAFRAMDAREAIVDQRVDIAIGDRVDAAAATAVAAVGSAARNVFLAAKGGGAVAAVAGQYFDRRFVDEFHGFLT